MFFHIYTFCALCNPGAAFNQGIVGHIQKSVGRCTCRSSHSSRRLALPPRQGRATQKPTQNMCTIHPFVSVLTNGYNEDYMNTYPNGHLSLLCHLTGIQVCETLKSQKNKASDKRLFLYVIPPRLFCLSDCFKVRMWQIYNLSLNKENGLVFFFKEMSGFLAFYECPAHARLSTLKRTRQARAMASAQDSMVAPVVMTSSTNKIWRPSKFPGCRTAKMSRTFSRRCRWSKVVWLGLDLVRTTLVVSVGMPVASDMPHAIQSL